MRLKTLAALIACLINVVPVSALACDTEAQEHPDSECVVTARNGRRGVWFQLEMADTLRREHLEIPELRLQLTHHESMAAIQAERVTMYNESINLERRANESLRTQLDASERREAAATARSRAWYHSPPLWFALGAVVTSTVVVVSTTR